MSIALDQGVVRDRGHAAWAHDGVGAQGAIGDIGQWWHRLVAENEQGEVRAPEEVEEPHLLTACGTDTGCVGGAVPGADARRVIEVAGKSGASVGNAKLGKDHRIWGGWCWLLDCVVEVGGAGTLEKSVYRLTCCSVRL